MLYITVRVLSAKNLCHGMVGKHLPCGGKNAVSQNLGWLENLWGESVSQSGVPGKQLAVAKHARHMQTHGAKKMSA